MNYIVTGKAGSGKTTALRRLAFSVIEKVLTDTNIKTVPIIIKSTAIAAQASRYSVGYLDELADFAKIAEKAGDTARATEYLPSD